MSTLASEISGRYVFSFWQGDGKNKQLLGGKGANLCEMTQIGLNVPPGFVITTEACLEYLKEDKLPEGLMDEVRAEIKKVEEATGKTYGRGPDPLLVSVRSGSALSMPGMMDTILNLGLNEETLEGLIEQTGDKRFAYDAYRRFIQLTCSINPSLASLARARWNVLREIPCFCSRYPRLGTMWWACFSSSNILAAACC